MVIEKKKLELIRKYNSQIETFNGKIQGAIGLLFTIIVLIVYINQKHIAVLGFLFFLVIWMILLYLQTIRLSKENPFVIKAIIVSKTMYTTHRTTPETIRRLKLEIDQVSEVDANLQNVRVLPS